MSSVAPITAAPVTSTATSVVDEAHAPASVRNGSAAVKQAYASAQGFEEMLLQQLSSSLVQSSGLSGKGNPVKARAKKALRKRAAACSPRCCRKRSPKA